MEIFVKLLLAHFIGDFLLQPNKWVIHKEANKARSQYLYFHILVHLSLYILVLWDLRLWKTALIIALGHFLIDAIKLYVNPYFKNAAIPFLADQLLHVIVLYGCSFYGELPQHFVGLIQDLDWPLLTAIVFVTFPSAIIMGKLLEGMSDRIGTDHKSLPNAGKYIGIIERLFVLVFILIGRWEAIGLLITAKSVFRFNDLKETNNRKLTEYILIGTLVSFGLAILAGLAYAGITEA
ncbi:DUF3307 domain-containing protein [Maribacter sp. 2210JD10-5]|uniref:DUF3307 domain-containing protein n=1 Tax=Maribacter sp. 2210JD10-5 TaxID=3386272 RepID=UPI0039BD8870